MATYTNLNVPRIASAALEGFIKEMLPLMAFSTSFSPEAVNARTGGNIVLVPLVGALTATTFGGSYAICGGTKSVVTVTMSRHKVVHIGQQDLDALNNSDSALESFGYAQGGALAQAVVEDILTIATSGSFTPVTTVTSTTLDVPQIRLARLALNQGNAPKNNRVALIDSVAMDAMLGVTNLVQAHMYKDNAVLQEGKVLRILGFDCYELNSSFTASVSSFYAHPNAIAIAMRYVQPQKPDAYDRAEAFSDPKTGATIGLRDVYDPLTGTRYLALECNYGYAAGITNGGRVIKRSD